MLQIIRRKHKNQEIRKNLELLQISVRQLYLMEETNNDYILVCIGICKLESTLESNDIKRKGRIFYY